MSTKETGRPIGGSIESIAEKEVDPAQVEAGANRRLLRKLLEEQVDIAARSLGQPVKHPNTLIDRRCAGAKAQYNKAYENWVNAGSPPSGAEYSALLDAEFDKLVYCEL